MTENKIIIPIWKKSNLTVEEAAAYCGIGSRKLREMSDSEFCPFVLLQIAVDDDFIRNNPSDNVLLPHFSCHSLRHTFTTRMCEAGVNIKVIQDALGHSDISTTLNIYADVTKEMKAAEFKGLDSYFKV